MYMYIPDIYSNTVIPTVHFEDIHYRWEQQRKTERKRENMMAVSTSYLKRGTRESSTLEHLCEWRSEREREREREREDRILRQGSRGVYWRTFGTGSTLEGVASSLLVIALHTFTKKPSFSSTPFSLETLSKRHSFLSVSHWHTGSLFKWHSVFRGIFESLYLQWLYMVGLNFHIFYEYTPGSMFDRKAIKNNASSNR